MKWRALSIVAMVVACVSTAQAVPTYRTARLATIARATGIALPDTLPAYMSDDTTWTYRGHALHVATNAFGDVSSIGYALFSREVRQCESVEHNVLFDFIERYALELDLPMPGGDAAMRMMRDNVVCNQGRISMLSRVSVPLTPMSLDEQTLRHTRISWTVGGQPLTLTVPADYQLLAGADGKELEEIFERDVKRVVPIDADAALDDWSAARIYRSDSLMIAELGEYLNPAIRGDVYLTERDGQRELLFDSRSPQRSVVNILLTGQYARPVPLRLTIDKYGYTQSVLDVSVQQLIALCKLQHCQLFVGIKTHTAERITATIFAVNKKLAYNHVISVDFPLDALRNEEAQVRATIYAYVPLHNVSEALYKRIMKQ